MPPQPYGLLTPLPRYRKYVFLLKVIVPFIFVVYCFNFFYRKCDTRQHMEDILIKTTTILQSNHIEYWLDKGTLLGIHRDQELIPWEYDTDLGVMNSTCDKISLLKPVFEKHGLIAYDRNDYIPQKSKLTYNTEHQHFYWSDPYLHDPCIRIFDKNDLASWMDIYWYIRVPFEEVKKHPQEYLIPGDYSYNEDLICCSEGIKKFTSQMCCGGCVTYSTLFPLVDITVTPYKIKRNEFIPQKSNEYLTINYGSNALKKREIKGWKSVVCGYWVNPLLFMLGWIFVISLIVTFIYMKKFKTPSHSRYQD